jgi:hypothetical protein
MSGGKSRATHRRLRWSVPLALGLAATTASADDWRANFEKSEMDDSQAVYLTTDSVTTVPGSSDIGLVRPSLTIRCEENTTAL